MLPIDPGPSASRVSILCHLLVAQVEAGMYRPVPPQEVQSSISE